MSKVTKSINEYMKLNYRMEIVEDKDEGGYVVSFPELPGCITIGDTIDDAVINALDAKKTWLQVAMEDNVAIPKPRNN